MRIFSLFGLRSLFGLQKLSSLASLSVIAGLPLLLSGCALTSTAPSSSSLPGQSSLKGITGVVHGGQQPIAGAQVYVFAAGTGGYGGNGIAASTANASTSLLFASSAAGYDTTQNLTGTSATNPLYGDYYVTTDSFGNFGLTGEYTCTAGTQVYLYALGGDPSPGVPNSASGLLAALGQCPSSGSMASVTPTVVMNEVSTVAAAYAMAGFATDAVHVSSSGTALAQTGIANAFANATNLENIATGTAYTTTTLVNGAGGNGTVPQSTINTIADILAACVNSAGPASSGCTTLFSNIKASGSTGTAATDTATAAIYLAHWPYPGSSQLTALYGSPAPTAPFTPTLGSGPNDFTIAISFTDGGTDPAMVAIDAAGDAWVVNYSSPNTLSKLSPLGVISTGSPFSGNGLPTNGQGSTAIDAQGIAIDPSGNVWLNNNASNSLSKFTNSGSAATNSPFTYATSAADVGGPIAIDAYGNLWILGGGSAAAGSGLNEISSSGTVLSPAHRAIAYPEQGYWAVNGYALGFDVATPAPGGIAIDKGVNNVFINATQLGSSVYGEVLDFSTSGDTFGTPSTGDGIGYHGAGLAYDSFGSVWQVDTSGLARFTAGTNPSAVYSSEIKGDEPPYSIAIDGAGTIWEGGIVNSSGNSYSMLAEFSNPGTTSNQPTLISPSNGFFASGTPVSNASTYAIALDGSGDLWYAGCNTNCATGQATQVMEFIGIAAPVITPLSAATASSSTGPGTRP